jgi:hypothetical protein
VSRTRVAVPFALLCVALLGGCSTAADGSSAATEEAVIGGIETVAPDASGRTTLGVIDAIEEAGTYDCAEQGSGWECVDPEGTGGAILVVGADEEQPTVSGAAPIDADTVDAIADALSAAPDEIYSDGAGLAWPAGQ